MLLLLSLKTLGVEQPAAPGLAKKVTPATIRSDPVVFIAGVVIGLLVLQAPVPSLQTTNVWAMRVQMGGLPPPVEAITILARAGVAANTAAAARKIRLESSPVFMDW